MKLNDIVMASTQDTKIRVVVKLYGTSFRTEHFPEYFLESCLRLLRMWKL